MTPAVKCGASPQMPSTTEKRRPSHASRLQLIACALALAPAARADPLPTPLPGGWFPDARCLPPDALPPDSLSAAITARAAWTPGLVPPFRAAARDRLSVGPSACLSLPGRARLSAAWDWLRDQPAAAPAISGPGDVRLGAAFDTLPLKQPPGPARLLLGWSVKLPDAQDEQELGTDETDVTLGLSGGWDARTPQGGWFLYAGAALGILGNPLLYADQDDLLLLRAEGGWTHVGLSLSASVSAAPQSDRNPARGDAIFSLRYAPALPARSAPRDPRPHGPLIALHAGAGLTPASADLALSLELGWQYRAPGASRTPVR